jgi:thiol-disulfide isomerase/thioredoxin
MFTIMYNAAAQDTRIIKLPELEKLLNPESDTTYVINFWATWCKPCIKELPHFDALEESFPGSRLKVILVSLDFRRQYETVLLPYVSKNKVKSQVLLIDEPDYNSWIDKVDPSWSGAIPATLIVNKKSGIRKFYEREFTRDEINETVKTLLP